MKLPKIVLVALIFMFFSIAVSINKQKNNHKWKNLAKNLIKNDAMLNDVNPVDIFLSK